MQGILLNDSGDLLIQNGAIQIGETSLQNQKLIIGCEKGELREFPTRGVGISKFLESDDSQALAREIKTQFSLDEMRVNQIIVNLPDITTDASYN